MSVLIPIWVSVVVLVGWKFRPQVSRTPPPALALSPASPRWRLQTDSLSMRVGGSVMRVANVCIPQLKTSAETTRDVGAGAVVLLLSSFVSWRLGALGVLGWFFLRWWRDRRRRARRAQEVQHQLPTIIDLFATASAAGLTVPLAVASVAEHLRDERSRGLFRQVSQAQERGVPVGEALARVSIQEPAFAPLIAALRNADHFGTALAPVLERLGDEARGRAQRHVEERVLRLPVLMLFPLVFCVLPAFVLLSVAPIIVTSVRSIHI